MTDPSHHPLGRVLFRTKDNRLLPALSSVQLRTLQQELLQGMEFSAARVCEAASYSMAMVVRFALGLTAENGAVCALLGNSLCGGVAAGTLRHLVNAGAHAACFITEPRTALNPYLQDEIGWLEKMEIPVHALTGTNDRAGLELFEGTLAQSHNLLYGLFDLHSPLEASDLLKAIHETVNEARTPVHCVECPCGVDPDNGLPRFDPLFASSTLSLGAPLAGLYHGDAYVGRHYLCDISITPTMYAGCGYDKFGSLFAEQPVIQIFPHKDTES